MKQHLKTLDTIKKRSELYYDLNRKVNKLQGDFYNHVCYCDAKIEREIVKLLDQILYQECGLVELASYYLYECNPEGKIICNVTKQEFIIRNIKDVQKVVSHFKKN